MLRSVIDEYAAADVASLTDSELEDDAAELAAALDRITALLADRTRHVGARGVHFGRGFTSPTTWLAHLGDMDRATASRVVGLGELIGSTESGKLFCSGEISVARASVMSSLRRDHEPEFARDEMTLIGFACEFSLRDFRRLARHWRNCADATLAEATVAEQRQRSYLHASTMLDGMVRIDGLFDQQTGEVVLCALDAAMTDAARDGEDQRPAPNRRAESMGEICRRWLDHQDDTSGGRRPHINVVVDLQTLQNRVGLDLSGQRCDLDHTGTITAETARALACDAGVSRILMSGESLILDVGRHTRTIPAAIRTALTIRDQHCRFSGCERPINWCDAHHIVHWADGGLTNLANLILVCRRHHGLIHQQPTTIRDGTIYLC